MAELSPQEITLGGLAPNLQAAAAGGDSMPIDGRTFLYVENTDTADHTITFDADQPTGYGPDFPDPAGVTVAAGSVALIGGKDLKRRFFGDVVSWTYDAETGLQIAAIRLTGVQPRDV